MTCHDLRERLLTGDLGDPDLADHLSGCAACSELAALLLRAESDLRRHLEDFVNAPTSTLDAQWAIALDRAPRRWGSRFQRAVVVAAAAAVLALVAWPVLGPEPGGEPESPSGAFGVAAVPSALRQARAKVEAFEAIDTEHLDVKGLDPAAEDARVKDAFARKVKALSAAEAALAAAAGDGDPIWRATAAGEIGDLYDAMADSLATFPAPSYLDAEEVAAYRAGMAPKVRMQRARALASLVEGAAFAREHDLGTLATEIDGRAAVVRTAMQALDRERLRALRGETCLGAAALDEAERALGGDLEQANAKLQALEDAAEACP